MPRPAHDENGQAYVDIQKNELYEVKIHNKSGRPVGIALSINRRFEPGSTLIVELQGKTRPRHLLVRVVRMIKLATREWLLGCSFLSRLNEEAVRDLYQSM